MKIERKRLLEWNSRKTFELAENEIILTFNSIKGGSILRILYSDIDPRLVDYKIAYAPYSSIAWSFFGLTFAAALLDYENTTIFALLAIMGFFVALYIFAKREYKGFMNRNHKTQSLFFIEMDTKKETADFLNALEVKLRES